MKAFHEFNDDKLYKDYLRHYYAGQALQGLLANPASGNDVNAILSCVHDAVRATDFLLSELSK